MKDDNAGLIIFDLDNTLVDKNAVFEKAQRKMIEIVKGSKATKKDLEILRKMDLILIKKKKNHLYPFEILALSLWLYYNENLDVRKCIQKSLNIFEGTSKRTEEIEEAIEIAEKAAGEHNNIVENTPAPLFRGVKKVLQTLKKRGYILILVSESNHSLQKKTLETYNLQQYFDDFKLCDQKEQCFFEIKKKFDPKFYGGEFKVVVIGDGIERDIKPGNEIGAITIWKPGDFNPGTPSPGMNQPDFSIRDVENLLTILP